jgi:hypothetical protein
MSTIAAAAQTPDRIDYWIRRHLIQYATGAKLALALSGMGSVAVARGSYWSLRHCLLRGHASIALGISLHSSSSLEAQR